MVKNRERFENLLQNTVVAEDVPSQERERLLSPLLDYVHDIIPASLFRYRECSEIQFDAFNNNLIYAVNAQKVNDPYDCLIRYDKQFLYDSLRRGASKEHIKQLRDSLKKGEPFPQFMASLYGEERTEILKKAILKATDEELDRNDQIFGMDRFDFFKWIELVFNEAESFLRHNTFIACFSETVKSVNMWSHYADAHKGFALEYDLRNRQIKCDKCKNIQCEDRIIHFLSPVIYSNERYDGTSFVDCFFGKQLGLFPQFDDVLFGTKAALYKSTQCAFEREWRLFLDKPGKRELLHQPYLCTEIRPIAIYYGKDISPINRKILSSMAKEKGLKEYEMYIDPQSKRYSMKYRRI